MELSWATEIYDTLQWVVGSMWFSEYSYNFSKKVASVSKQADRKRGYQ